MRALMIGCGNMGSSLLSRWADVDGTSFTVVDPVSEFSHPKVRVFKEQSALEDETFNFIIVAIKPQMIDDIVPAYLPHLTDDGALLSIAAGYSAKRLGTISGGKPVLRVMPNMPASLGQGTSGLYCSPSVTPEMRDAVHTIMAATGDVIDVDSEDELDRVTAVAGSGPGYVFEIARTYTEAAMSLGFDAETARRLALSTLRGAVAMALESEKSLEELRNSVTSKAGTTEAGLNALNGDGTLDRLLKETVHAAYERAVELR